MLTEDSRERLDTHNKQLQGTPLVLRFDGGQKKNTVLREDFAQAMNSETLLCEIEPFLGAYGPRLAHRPSKPGASDIAKCNKFLRAAGLLGDKGWTGFPTLPSESELTENDTFAPLQDILEKIWEFAEKEGNFTNPYHFQMIPDNHLDDNMQCGACVLEHRATPHSKIHNDIILMAWEFKLVDQIMVAGDCHHIMCDDPRRMHMYGVTMENNLFSLWYFSRSHSIKTFAFDWTSGKGINDFIHVMLYFAYASAKDFGLDPYVHKADRLDGQQQWVYEFNVPVDHRASVDSIPPPVCVNTRSTPSTEAPVDMKKIYYRTVQSRLPCRPICISGRVTRIWEVVRVGSVKDKPKKDDKRVILKDVWLDKESSTEGENQAKIFAAVDKFVEEGLGRHPGPNGLMDFVNNEPRFTHFDDKTKKRLAQLLTGGKYKELFLTKVLEWKGDTCRERSEHARRPVFPIFALASAAGRAGASNRTATAGSSMGVVPQTNATSIVALASDVQKKRLWAAKRQVRLVYEEVCTEIYNLKTLGEVMDIARQALDALQILYCAGWVHRDVSTGNILAVPSSHGGGWTVKLADLEFAQEVGHLIHKSDTRTGTPYFMAVEIMAKKYFALNLCNSDDTDSSDGLDLEFATVSNLATRFGLSRDRLDYGHYASFTSDALPYDLNELPILANHEPLSASHYAHNYQHDLESLWWIILYFVTAGIGHTKSEVWARRYFYREMNPAGRDGLFKSRLTLDECLADTCKQGGLHTVLELLRDWMYDEYRKRVIFKQMHVHESYGLIYAVFTSTLDSLLGGKNLQWRLTPVKLMDEHPAPVLPRLKA